MTGHALLSKTVLLLVAILAACTSPTGGTPDAGLPIEQGLPVQVEDTLNPVSSPTAAQENTPTIQAPLPGTAAVSQGEENSTLPLPHYTLTATLNYSQHFLSVDERIRYTNRSSDPLLDLRLMVDPLYYPGVFHLNGISWEAGETIADYMVETGQLDIPLGSPLLPGESLALRISYELDLPSPTPSAQVRPIPFGYTQRQTNLVDWYPFIPPYVDGQGWLAHPAGFFGEHLVYDPADFDVRIRIEDSPPGTIVAASAPDHAEGEWHRYEHRSARNFAWSASPEYQVFTTTVGDTTINSYAFTFHASAGEAVLKTTAESLALYNELYGPYPRHLLSAIEADFLDGMEYDGLYFLSNGFYNLYQGTPGEYLISIAAHETAHQWFYASVGNDQALEPWLDEALCTYQERIFYERLHPEALDWWWDYRVNYYNPSGWVNGSIYNPDGYRAYRDAVYLNGASFLEELRTTIGDAPFFAFLKDYVVQNAGKIATGDRFFEILSQHTNQDLSELINKFFKPG